MENDLLRSDKNDPSGGTQVQNQGNAVADAAAKAAEAAEAARKADAEERKKLADADHAAKVVAKANAEAKAYREKLEQVEAEAKAAKKALQDREEKELADQKKFQELAEKREKELERLQAQHAKEKEEAKAERERERAELEQGRVLDAVTIAAIKAGILDEEDVALPAFKEALAMAKVENGRIVGVTAAVAKMKELKPKKFATETVPETPEEKAAREAAEAQAARQQQRDAQGKFVPPTPSAGTQNSKNIDASKLNDKEWEEMVRSLRASR